MRFSFEYMGFPCSSVGKQSACSAEDRGSSPRLGRSPGEGNGKPLQYSSLGNPMDRGAWQVTVHGVARVEHDLTEYFKKLKVSSLMAYSKRRFST